MRRKHLVLFFISFIIPLVFYRFYVFLNKGKVSFLRELTGLNVHHSHYGIILLTIGVLLLVFDKVLTSSIIISGLGLGMTLDSFISSLMPSFSRVEEVYNYSNCLWGTVVLFLGVGLILVFLSRK